MKKPPMVLISVASAVMFLSRADISVETRLVTLEKRIEDLQRRYEARIAALEAEISGLKAPAARTVTASPDAQAPAPPGERDPGDHPQTANYFNPSISVIGNFLGVGGRNRTEDQPVSSLRESELSLQAVVDPFARADFFLSFGEEGVEVEEGFITLNSLPGGWLGKVGRMRVAFGKTNPLHLHVLPWPDEPLPIANLLGGDEGWVGTGMSAAHLVPMPADIFSEVTLQVLRGEAEGLFAAPKRSDLAYNGHYRLFKDLSESTNLDLGLSYGTGPNGTTPRADTHLQGIDATLRWKPLRTASYRSASLRGEFIRSRREQPGGAQSSTGWFLSGEYQLAKRWFLGTRAEASRRADDESARDSGRAALLTFWPSEFSQIRGELRRRRYNDVETANEVLLQVQFAIGAHGAHPF